jgi:hypothetical protein
MSEVSVSWRHRSPSARSALPFKVSLARLSDSIIDAVEKRERRSGRKDFSEENFDVEGVPPF